MKRFLTCFLLCVMLCACTERATAPREGRRSIGAQPDKIRSATGPVRLSQAEALQNWSALYTNHTNKRPHATLSADAKKIDSVSIGKGVSKKGLTLAGPVVVDKTIYTLDRNFTLQATDLETGKKLWRNELADIQGTTSKSIGLTRYGNTLFAVAGNGLVIATDFSGKELWRTDLKALLRSSATVDSGRLFVSSINNELFVLNTRTGKKLWQHKGEPAVTNLFGMGTPGVHQSIAVMPSTDGRVNAFDVNSGVMLWTENLWTNKTYNPMLDIPHITSSPVIEGGRVYLVGNAGKSGVYLLENGTPIYTLNLGGRETPFVDKNAWYIITNTGKLVALSKDNGAQYWETPLTSSEKDTPSWYGPVLAGASLVVTSSLGDIIFYDPKTGKEQRREKRDELYGAPVFAQGRMILLTTDGDLLIYQ